MWINSLYLIRRVIGQGIRENADFSHGVILDYGCGSRPYESLFTCSNYVGVDVHISGHPAESKKADLYFSDGRVPVEDGTIDGVLASEVFEHVFDLPSALSDIFRILKPGGRLLATCPFVWPLHEEPYDFARYTPFALRTLLENAGFKVLKLEQRGRPVEVLGQMFLYDILPSLVPSSNILFRFAKLMVCGTVTGVCRILARDNRPPSKLYLTNLILVEKPQPID